MTETDLFVALALLLAGVAVGILVMIWLGIKRDDEPGGFPAHTDDSTARAARQVIGVGTRHVELTDETSRRRNMLLV